MLTDISPSDFKDAFEQTTQEQLSILLSCWSSQPKFTKYTKEVLMPRVAELLECSLETEYRRIDIVLRRSPGRILVAVEHENNFGGSAVSEMTKLSNLEAGLGVLITYVSERQRQRMIAEYNQAMNADKILGIGTRCENILLIIGPYGMKPPRTLQWTYYSLDGREFGLL